MKISLSIMPIPLARLTVCTIGLAAVLLPHTAIAETRYQACMRGAWDKALAAGAISAATMTLGAWMEAIGNQQQCYQYWEEHKASLTPKQRDDAEEWEALIKDLSDPRKQFMK